MTLVAVYPTAREFADHERVGVVVPLFAENPESGALTHRFDNRQMMMTAVPAGVKPGDKVTRPSKDAVVTGYVWHAGWIDVDLKVQPWLLHLPLTDGKLTWERTPQKERETTEQMLDALVAAMVAAGFPPACAHTTEGGLHLLFGWSEAVTVAEQQRDLLRRLNAFARRLGVEPDDQCTGPVGLLKVADFTTSKGQASEQPWWHFHAQPDARADVAKVKAIERSRDVNAVVHTDDDFGMEQEDAEASLTQHPELRQRVLDNVVASCRRKCAEFAKATDSRRSLVWRLIRDYQRAINLGALPADAMDEVLAAARANGSDMAHVEDQIDRHTRQVADEGPNVVEIIGWLQSRDAADAEAVKVTDTISADETTTFRIADPNDDHAAYLQVLEHRCAASGKPDELLGENAMCAAYRLQQNDPSAFVRVRALIANRNPGGLKIKAFDDCLKHFAKVQAAAKDKARVEARRAAGRPQVPLRLSARENHEATVAAMVEVNQSNPDTPAFLSTPNGKLARVAADGIQEQSKDSILLHTVKHIDFSRSQIQDGVETRIDANPDENQLRMLHADDEHHLRLPVGEGISVGPLLNLDTLETKTAGYDTCSRTMIVEKAGLSWGQYRVPAKATRDDARKGIQFIVEEILADFPYVDMADRANHVVEILAASVGQSFGDHCTPIFVHSAPQHRTGKTLAAQVTAGIVGHGSEVVIGVSQKATQGEFDKAVLPVLGLGLSTKVFDNVDGHWEAPGFAAAKTAGRYYRGRVLGASTLKSVRANTVDIVTLNDASMSVELAERSILIEQDTNSADPNQRTGFKHVPLLGWIKGLEGYALAQCHTAIKAFLLHRGSLPKFPVPTFGSFEWFTELFSGVLQFADCDACPGGMFLDNADRMRRQCAVDNSAWKDAMAAMIAQFGANEFTAQQVAVLDLDLFVVPGLTNDLRARAVAVGRQLKLRQRKPVVIDGLLRRLKLVPNDSKKHASARWVIETVDPRAK